MSTPSPSPKSWDWTCWPSMKPSTSWRRKKAELVKSRFFAGLTNEQAADALGISPRTAYADWGYAKAWLRVEMSMLPAKRGNND